MGGLTFLLLSRLESSLDRGWGNMDPPAGYTGRVVPMGAREVQSPAVKPRRFANALSKPTSDRWVKRWCRWNGVLEEFKRRVAEWEAAGVFDRIAAKVDEVLDKEKP